MLALANGWVGRGKKLCLFWPKLELHIPSVLWFAIAAT